MNTQEQGPETDDEMALGGEARGAVSPRQELALQAVLSHSTLKEAAAAAGVGDTTLWRYMNDPEFSRRLREARRGAAGHAAVRLQRGASEAVAVLRDLMTNEGAPPAARVMAARTVIDYPFRVAEMDDLRGQPGELERFLIRKQASRCEFCGTPWKYDLSGYPKELREVARLYHASDFEDLFTDPRVWAARRWMDYWEEARR